MSTTLTTPRDTRPTIGGRRLYLREWGPPDAPAAVLLHGIVGNSHEWDTVAARLSAGRRMILPDQPGHGASDWAGAAWSRRCPTPAWPRSPTPATTSASKPRTTSRPTSPASSASPDRAPR